jgi:hypothetical protein
MTKERKSLLNWELSNFNKRISEVRCKMSYPIQTIGALHDEGFGIITTIIKNPVLTSEYGKGIVTLEPYSLN